MGNEQYGVRLSPELGAIVQARANADGATVSDVIRNVLHAWAYGEAPGANEGYYAARGDGVRIAHYLVAKAFAELPASAEEAQELLSSMPPVGPGFRPG